MKNLLARLWLRLWRWTVVPVSEPMPDRCVIIAAPHTTNWDFPLMLAHARVCGVKLSWLGKDSLFRGPMGPIIRRFGGVAIDRSAPGGMVAALAKELNERPVLRLLVPAEGTRSKTEYWKSGFYRIAQQADVPLVLSFLDRSTRSGGFGRAFHLTGDVCADMDVIRAFYAGKTGLKDNRFGPIRLREEEAPDTSEA